MALTGQLRLLLVIQAFFSCLIALLGVVSLVDRPDPGYSTVILVAGCLDFVAVAAIVLRLSVVSSASADESLTSSRQAPFKPCVPEDPDAVQVQAAWPENSVEEVVVKPELSARLASLEKEGQDLLRSLTAAKQELVVAGTREKGLRDACRFRSACLMRLASQLTRLQRTEISLAGCKDDSTPASAEQQPVTTQEQDLQASVETSEVAVQSGAAVVHSAAAVQASLGTEALSKEPSPENASQDEEASTADGETESPRPTSAQGKAAESPKSGPMEIIMAKLKMLSEENEQLRGELAAVGEENSAAAAAKQEAATAKSPAAEKLATLASANPAIRELVLQKLRSAVPDEAMAAVPVRSSEQELELKLNNQASETHRWQQECQRVSLQLQEASREASHLAAGLRESQHRVHRVETELEECRKYQEVRKVVINPEASDSPALRFRWVDDCKPMSSQPGSTKGAEELKRSLCSVTAGPSELAVGPPPADWKVFLQLRLRRMEPWNPAMLQLSVPDCQDGSFVGLLWPTSEHLSSGP